MTKEEMKDRISMALKDPILQQGFEIICKENAELKKEVEKHKWNDIFLEESAFYDKKIAEEYTTLQERIAELEKENAELKGKLKTAYRKGMRHMAKALKYYDRTDGAWTDYFEHTVDNNQLKRAFLAGLKAGRPEWHDLRKDPNDLPKRNNELIDRSDVIITDKGIAHYNFRKQKWYVHNFECDMSFSEGVIAWCEIPTFTDKE